jgi:HK97 family phage prohead protease
MSNNQKREYRFLTSQVRAKSGTKPGISGYAARYGKATMIEPGLREIINKGAFTQTVKRKDSCIACFNHDESKILGRVSAGTLRLRDDSDGLYFDCDTPDTSYANDLLESIRRGDIAECSFGFYLDPDGDDFSKDADGTILRQIRSCSVFDVSPVTNPAYGGGVTSVAARSRAQFPDGLPFSEARMKEATSRVSVPTISGEAFDPEIAQRAARLALERLKF